MIKLLTSISNIDNKKGVKYEENFKIYTILAVCLFSSPMFTTPVAQAQTVDLEYGVTSDFESAL